MRQLLVVAIVVAACGGHNNGNNGDAGDGSDGGVGDAPTDGPGCPAYQHMCNGACIPTNDDPDNCGGCGTVCSAAQVCSSGKCVDSCQGNLTACNRRCVDLNSDSANCKTCGTACGPGTGCSDGACVPSQGATTAPGCAGGGPPVDLGNGTSSNCTAQTTFRWALCSCLDVTSSNSITTDAYDSSQGPYVPGGPGAGVGMNRMFGSSGVTNVSGSLWASAAAGLSTSNDLHVGQELHVGGPLSSPTCTVGDDGYVKGNISTTGSIAFGKTLYQQTGTTTSGTVTYASRVEQNVTVPEPCECQPNQILPISTWVAAAMATNDNASISLSATAAQNPSSPVRIDLPCGKYYLSAITGSRAVTIVAHGHTALFVGGDISLSKPLAITLDPTATLDVVVGGNVGASSTMTIGSPNYPALSRYYIGGSNGFSISSGAELAAYFYTSQGLVGSSSSLEVFGGVFAHDFNNSSSTKIHYDGAVLDVGGDCGTGTGCTSCNDCGNQACINGSCGACTDSSQCCAPLVCDPQQGKCVDVIIL